MSNSEKYPDAWKIYNDCFRKWNASDDKEYPSGWKYGIPNPEKTNEYLYAECSGKFFMKIKNLFYENHGVAGFRIFLWQLELTEGKVSKAEYDSNIKFLQRN